MDKIFLERLFESHKACPTCPSPEEVTQIFKQLLGILFPDYSEETFQTLEQFEAYVKNTKNSLEQMVGNTAGNSMVEAPAVVNRFFESLATVYKKLEGDISAMYQGDPAAKSLGEVVRTYPGFYAIAAYRLAHELHQLNIAGVPRVITEHAHSKTGIDIHPAASIGEHFCIDHGTGIVIGETTVIGSHVKIYQGVTLGALSVDKNDAEKKRHPTIEDRVVIYAGATILGGETIIGNDSIIGGNVWLTRSIPPFSKIYYQAKMFNGETEEVDHVVFKSGTNS